MRSRGLRPIMAALALGAVAMLSGCDSAAPGPGGEPIDLRAQGAGWVLEVRVPSSALLSIDAIDLQTTLTWTGPAAKASIWGSGMGPVTFQYAEVGGAGRQMGGAMTADCAQHEYAQGVPVAIPAGKGWLTDGSDPNLAFYQAWSNDPALHLPAGTWKLVVGTDGMLAPCDINAPTLKLSIPFVLTLR